MGVDHASEGHVIWYVIGLWWAGRNLPDMLIIEAPYPVVVKEEPETEGFDWEKIGV